VSRQPLLRDRPQADKAQRRPNADTDDKAGDLDVPVEPETPGDHPPRKRLLLEGVVLAAIYQALTIVFLKPLRTAGQTFYGDVLIGWFGPEKHGAAQYVRDGFLPTWTRDQFAGEPFIANIQHAILYPGNLPFWIFETSTALKVVAATHIALAAIGMWAYCRLGLRTGMWGAVIAGLAFGFGAQTLLHIVLINQLQVIAWMPFVLLFGYWTLEKGKLRHIVGTAVAIGLQFLSGHPEEWVYTLVALALSGVFWALLADLGPLRQRARAVLSGALRLGASVGLFALLFGWQLLPTLQLQEQGWRSTPGFAEQHPLAEGVTLNALLPDYANVLKGEWAGFVGVIVLGLAALGIAAGRRDLRWVRVWTGVMTVLGVFMAVGLRSPLYRIAYEHVSVITEFRVPSRWLLLGTFGMAAAAAVGMDVLLSSSVGALGRRVRQAAGALALLAVLFLTAMSVGNAAIDRATIPWWIAAGAVGAVAWLLASLPRVPRAALAIVLILVTGAELRQARPLAEQHVVADDSVYDDPGPIMERMGSQGGRYVTITGEPLTPDEALTVTVPPGLTGLEGAYYRAGHNRSLSARPGWSYATHAETIQGRDGGLMPLRTWAEFFEATIGAPGMTRSGVFQQPPSKWNFATLDFLGVRWFVTPGMGLDEAKILHEHGFQVAQRAGYVLAWERPQPPIARMQYDLDVIPGASQRLERLKSGYPLATRAIVEQDVPGLTGDAAVRRFAAPPAPAQVTTTELGQTTVKLRVRTERDGLLVLADPWYPGWQVKVDGESSKLYRVDHAFRGVKVPGGEHEVVFTYVDRSMQLGAALAVLAVAGLVAFWLITRRRRKAKAAQASSAAA
jgi:hypothetical protein